MRVKGKIICLFIAVLLLMSAGCGKSEEGSPQESNGGGEDITAEGSENGDGSENGSGSAVNGGGSENGNGSENNGEGEEGNGSGANEGGSENGSGSGENGGEGENESENGGEAENGGSGENNGESGNGGSEAETDIVLGYKFDVGANWKLAYADTDYLYYYMMENADTYDSNVVLSVTSDTSLAAVKLSELEQSLKKQYGDKAVIEKGATKENGESMIYIELEQMNGDVKARIGQYIVVGKEKAVIFSVYSEESKFETAKKYAGYVVNTISFDK